MTDKAALRDVLTEAGRFRYRCADGGYNAVSDDLIVACLWHGPECIDWYLQVDPEQVASFIAVPPSTSKEAHDA